MILHGSDRPTIHRTYRRFTWLLIGALAISVAVAACAHDEDRAVDPEVSNGVIILATTTSTQDSGLLDLIVPIFEDNSGYFVKVIAVGTGQALRMGESGNADALLVHAPEAEKVLVSNRNAIDRQLVMHNDFIIVGPVEDQAGISGLKNPNQAFAKISESGSSFVSRGDDSGTHKKELAIWSDSGIEPIEAEYLESGTGMAATLRIASEKQAYTLTDRATYLSQRDTLDLDILVEGHASLLNLYHTMTVNPEIWPLVNYEGAQAWSRFLLSETTQGLIGKYGIDRFGQPLFFPDAGLTENDISSE